MYICAHLSVKDKSSLMNEKPQTIYKSLSMLLEILLKSDSYFKTPKKARYLPVPFHKAQAIHADPIELT